MYVLLAVFGSNHSCNKSGENTCGEDDRSGRHEVLFNF